MTMVSSLGECIHKNATIFLTIYFKVTALPGNKGCLLDPELKVTFSCLQNAKSEAEDLFCYYCMFI